MRKLRIKMAIRNILLPVDRLSYSNDTTSQTYVASAKSTKITPAPSHSRTPTETFLKPKQQQQHGDDCIPPPFVTRISTPSMVTLSLSLSEENKVKINSQCKELAKAKKSIFVPPPVQNLESVLQRETHKNTKKRAQRKQKKVKFQEKQSLLTQDIVGLSLPEISTGLSQLQLKLVTYRTFLVHYFPEDTIKVKVNRDEKWHHSTSDDDGITFAKLKHTAALALRIELTSLNFFGLFLGQLGDPKELCIDDATVPQNVDEVCFQRIILITDKEERYYLSIDDRAMGLIFWELKDQYDRGQLIPLPSKVDSEEMERLLLAPHYGITVKKKFVDLVLGFPLFYWSYYHKVNYCILQSSVWPGDYSVCNGTVIHVVPGREKLVFLDVSGEVEIEALPWHRIRSLTMKNKPIMTIEFEIILVLKGRCLRRFISVATDCNKFLYTVSIYMLRILQSRDTSGCCLLPSVDPYITKQQYLKTMDETNQSEISTFSSEEVTFDKLNLRDDGCDKIFLNKYCFRGPVYFKSKSCFSFCSEYDDTSSEEEMKTNASGVEQYEEFNEDNSSGRRYIAS